MNGNFIVAGTTGSGMSYHAKLQMLEQLQRHGYKIVTIDPKTEHGTWDPALARLNRAQRRKQRKRAN